MSKEKQIEEMSTQIRDAVNGCSSYWSRLIAEHLYEEGYRKQSEGEWIFEHEYYGKMLCSNCKGEALVNECSEYVDSDYCPNCGAKMKGGE